MIFSKSKDSKTHRKDRIKIFSNTDTVVGAFFLLNHNWLRLMYMCLVISKVLRMPGIQLLWGERKLLQFGCLARNKMARWHFLPVFNRLPSRYADGLVDKRS